MSANQPDFVTPASEATLQQAAEILRILVGRHGGQGLSRRQHDVRCAAPEFFESVIVGECPGDRICQNGRDHTKTQEIFFHAKFLFFFVPGNREGSVIGPPAHAYCIGRCA